MVRYVRAVMQSLRVLLVIFERSRADDVTPDQVFFFRDEGFDVDAARVDVEVLLLPGQHVFAFALRKLNISGGDERRIDGADRIGVEAVAVADPARALAPVAQVDRHRIVGVAGLNPYG